MFPSPSLEPPTLQNYQFQYNGLTFGAGTAWGVLGVEGLDLAEIRNGDVNWPRDHGQAKGLDVFAGKDVIFDLWVKTDGTSLQHAMLALAAATGVRPNEELPLWFQLPNLPLLCVMCRPRKRPYKINSDYAAANIATPELVLHTTDPRLYTAGKATALAPNHPTTTVVITNTGNVELRPIVIFTGPVTNPFIQNATITGELKLEFINPAVAEAREAIEAEKSKKWAKEVGEGITQKEREEKEAALKTELVKKEKEEAEKSEKPTVKAWDQLYVDLGTPHRIRYYSGGVVTKVFTSAARWLAPGSIWWDLLVGASSIKFGSIDNSNTGGTASVQWADAYEL